MRHTIQLQAYTSKINFKAKLGADYSGLDGNKQLHLYHSHVDNRQKEGACL